MKRFYWKSLLQQKQGAHINNFQVVEETKFGGHKRNK